MAKYTKYKPINKVKPVKVTHDFYKEGKEEPKRAYKKGRGVGEQEIVKMIFKEVSKAKSKIKTLEKNNLTDAPFYKKFKEALKNKEFSTAGKDLKSLLQTHAKIKSFNAMKTSYKKGAKEWKETSSKFSSMTKDLPEDSLDKLNELYTIFLEEQPYWLNVFSPNELMIYVYDIIIKSGYANGEVSNRSEMLDLVNMALQDIYERKALVNDFAPGKGFSVNDL